VTLPPAKSLIPKLHPSCPSCCHCIVINETRRSLVKAELSRKKNKEQKGFYGDILSCVWFIISKLDHESDIHNKINNDNNSDLWYQRFP
jgi:hypothetical protein